MVEYSQLNYHMWGSMSGPGGIRNPDFLSAIEIPELSTMSTAYIWSHKVHPVTKYGGQNVQAVHNFHAVLPALHPVAPNMKKGRATHI